MAQTTTTVSVSLTEPVISKGRKRSIQTDRGNFSAYVERLIRADCAKQERLEQRQQEQAVAA